MYQYHQDIITIKTPFETQTEYLACDGCDVLVDGLTRIGDFWDTVTASFPNLFCASRDNKLYTSSGDKVKCMEDARSANFLYLVEKKELSGVKATQIFTGT